VNILDLAKRFSDYEAEQSRGTDSGSEFFTGAWAWAFRQLSHEECATLDAKGPVFLFEDNSNDSLWEKVQDLLNFFEEWYYSEFAESLAAVCDDKGVLADPDVWHWMLLRIAFSREDYAFCNALLETKDEDLCYRFFQGSEYGSLANDPRYSEFTAIVPDYDSVPLHTRLDAAHTLWETAAMSQGEDWRAGA
jgi:hypothetical protein